MRYLSLFSGLEAAHLALAALGWECVAVFEIDPAACAVLRHRLPDVPNLGSVTDITDEQIAALGPIDAVIGGSPCQDLSVAGRRAGLAGARSSLFHHQLRIFYAARHFCGARWLWWENVPGAFSSNDGRDFAVVVGEMAGCDLTVPRDGWASEGMAVGQHGLVEWSVLDAQWFGLAQRRRRVFAVLDTGNWTDRRPVLLEPDSLRGDSAPRRGQGEGIASTLTAGAGSSSGPGMRAECDGGSGLIQHTLGYGGGRTSGEIEVAACLTAKGMRIDFEVETFLVQPVAHTLRAGGFDGSEDGTGRGTPLIAFDCKAAGDTGISIGDVPGTLRAAHGGGHAAVAYAIQAGATRVNPASGPDGVGVQADHAYTIEARAEVQAVGYMPNQVRRLTPRECERLQGVPDDWTLVPNARGKPMADGPRYKMLGNSFAVTVIHWIGEQIQHAHDRSSEIQRLRDAATQATEQLRAALARNRGKTA
ncbi:MULTISPECIES: DNA cytosine methyltransferase [Stenotrophomonas maltophilia group]|uniref:DNA cytosine methyltransferase n=1 Tax=Stenotrophomonas maltophilia group TaxID=995085 RepID=UPI001F16B879|nr:DNA cytosine methyltransferase [Stenotrophomonas maltophilia]MCF3495491.1 DNA (cytosine-5-)-methyltransferase [Stenotrophomonas maltophilia]